ncbi:MAG: sulfate adenylyltransferase [Burkholderiales bacterium]|nr:sulfate adenylyltransferase [Burkholderiales bacterium]
MNTSSSNDTQSAQNRPLRFITCGSVDDGKSTLIGRLLYDSKALMLDQLDALGRARGAQSRNGQLDLSLVTDGLEAEREQGITIDVAYRYFATPKRKFIIADAPGHEQYTRNMVTGASRSDVAVVLIDVTKLDFSTARVALLPQTKRHTALVALLRLQHIVVAVNKMDAIGFDADKFERVVRAFGALAASLGIASFTAIPLSALDGDGVVAHTGRTAWFQGPALLPHLESLSLHDGHAGSRAHIAVQWVTRDDRDDHVRWVTGDVAEAALAVGGEIRVFPGGAVARVAAIRTARGEVQQAQPGEAVAVRFDRQVDMARGDWIVADAQNAGAPRQTAQATLAWLDTAPLTVGRRYVVRHGTRWLPARVTAISSRLDLQAGEWSDVAVASNDDWAAEPGPAPAVNANDLVRAEIEFAQPLPLAAFAESAVLGSFVLVDPGTHATAAAGMIAGPARASQRRSVGP